MFNKFRSSKYFWTLFFVIKHQFVQFSFQTFPKSNILMIILFSLINLRTKSGPNLNWKQLLKFFFKQPVLNGSDQWDGAWIGLNDIVEEGWNRWDSGRQVGFTHFYLPNSENREGETRGLGEGETRGLVETATHEPGFNFTNNLWAAL